MSKITMNKKKHRIRHKSNKINKKITFAKQQETEMTKTKSRRNHHHHQYPNR